jgi:hypothetical protein
MLAKRALDAGDWTMPSCDGAPLESSSASVEVRYPRRLRTAALFRCNCGLSASVESGARNAAKACGRARAQRIGLFGARRAPFT